MKIAVLRARPPAGLLALVPALRALDAAYPDALIALVGSPEAREFAGRLRRYLDAFVEFPGFPGVPFAGGLGDLPRFYELMASQQFDLALQMHDDGRLTNPLTVLMNARQTAGFYVPGRYCPDPQRFVPWQEDEPEVESCLRLLARLGVPAKGTHLEFPLTEADWSEWRALGLERYVCICPDDLHAANPWPAESFAAVGDALVLQGWRVVLCGAEPSSQLAHEVGAAMHEPPLELAGRLTLGGLAALLARSRLVVASDPDVLQMAAAMRTPRAVPGTTVDDVMRQALEAFARAA
jgi:ADP-heptose:LPS heptosyltransferase